MVGWDIEVVFEASDKRNLESAYMICAYKVYEIFIKNMREGTA